MKKNNKIFIALISIIVILIIFIIVLCVSFKSFKTKSLSSEPDTNIVEEIEPVLSEQELRRTAFLEACWGDNYYNDYVNEFLINDPWEGVDISDLCPETEEELELITLIIYNFNPSLLLDDEESFVTIGGTEVDLKTVPEVYTRFKFYYSGEDRVKVTGYRNDNRFTLTFKDSEMMPIE